MVTINIIRKVYKKFPKLKLILLVLDIFMVPILFFVCFIARFRVKDFDVGLGPDPLINNVYHKKALEIFGYSAKTFVFYSYFITSEFDVDASKRLRGLLYVFAPLYLFVWSVWRCRCIYIYFNGGSLGRSNILSFFEPFMYRLSKTNVVVMPYGGDVQDMLRSNNLLFRNAQSVDYPLHQRTLRLKIQRNIDRWVHFSDHVIGGCDWVYYIPMWNTLTLGHFSIDFSKFDRLSYDQSRSELSNTKTLKILHSPNHRNIKGTSFFEQAVSELVSEGLDIELLIIEKMPNDELMKLMASVDIVADQLIIGWYAMTCLEGMALSKPVLCYIDPGLLKLYQAAGLLGLHERVPVVDCDPWNVKEKIRYLYENREIIKPIGKSGYDFARKHHSLEAVGAKFDKINRGLGIEPSMFINKDMLYHQ